MRSPRLCRFLSFVVECWSEGTPAKESVIGTEVFDRAPDYDPRIDPIVRVEAGRLRRKLKEYYATVGVRDELEISMPVGGYSLQVRQRMAPRQSSVSPYWWESWSNFPSLGARGGPAAQGTTA